MFITVIEARF